MKTNKEQVVIQSVQGSIHHPCMRGDAYRVGYDGKGRITVATGGIVYNYKIGDCCMGIPGDHIEPGVSLKNKDANENNALQTLACVGNVARVISGDAKGKTGIVTGKHGGVDHVMIYFDDETLNLLNVDDKIAIKACGLGFKLLEHSDVMMMNIDPSLFLKLGIKENSDGVLEVPVTTIVPAHLMGSGLGCATMIGGDYDIMTQDKEVNKKHNLDSLRFGDFVYIENHDNFNGPHYREGSGSIGIIAHSDSFTSGHGPGVTVLMCARNNKIKPILDPHANIAEVLKIK